MLLLIELGLVGACLCAFAAMCCPNGLGGSANFQVLFADLGIKEWGDGLLFKSAHLLVVAGR